MRVRLTAGKMFHRDLFCYLPQHADKRFITHPAASACHTLYCSNFNHSLQPRGAEKHRRTHDTPSVLLSPITDVDFSLPDCPIVACMPSSLTHCAFSGAFQLTAVVKSGYAGQQLYPQLIAHTAFVHAVRGTCAGPQVSEAFDSQRVATVAVSGDFEVQVTII